MWHIECETAKSDETILVSARAATDRLLRREDLGFLQLPSREALWSSSEHRARDIRRGQKRMVVLGMGGSSLGGRAISQALGGLETACELVFIDNVDADRFWRWMRGQSDFDETHWVIISKSGNTIETLTMAELADQYLRGKGFRKLAANATVISENADNSLTRWARKEGVAALEIPKDVGGRFSVLSPVGMLPAAFIGLEIDKFREGASWALAQEELVARLVAQSLMSFRRDEWITLFWSYADGLRDFGAWAQQLWAESLGKRTARNGEVAPRASTPMPAIGSSDQHSILQQVMEGSHDKFVWFFRSNQSESSGPAIEASLFDGQEVMRGKGMGDLFGAMAEATRTALAHEGVQSLTLRTDRLNEKSLGALFMLLQLTVGAIGEAMNIDAFDQPGVELGKTLAKRLLSERTT